MTYPRIVKQDAAGPEPHISHDAVRAKLEMLLAENPTAITIIAEIGSELKDACVPNSWTLFRGMVNAVQATFEGTTE